MLIKLVSGHSFQNVTKAEKILVQYKKNRIKYDKQSIEVIRQKSIFIIRPKIDLKRRQRRTLLLFGKNGKWRND